MEPRCYDWRIDKEDDGHWLVGTFSHWNKKDQEFVNLKGSVKLNAVAGEHAWTEEGYFQLCPALDLVGGARWPKLVAGPDVWPLGDPAPVPSRHPQGNPQDYLPIPGVDIREIGSDQYLNWWDEALLKAGLTAVEVTC
jgi:hypothetical protein